MSTICRHACFGVQRLVSAAWYTSRYMTAYSLSRSEAREKNVDVVRDWDLSVTSQLMKRSAQHTQA